jgi:hypothetical protein
MSSLRNKALDIAQRYCGMTPKDLGVETYAQMQEKMANEIVSLAKKNNITIVGAGSMDAEMAIVHLSKTMGRDFSTIDIHDINKNNLGLGRSRDVNYLLTDVAKIKTEDLLGKTKMLKNEVGEMEEEGTRGVTNNRKTKKRKKAKNGKKR